MADSIQTSIASNFSILFAHTTPESLAAIWRTICSSPSAKVLGAVAIGSIVIRSLNSFLNRLACNNWQWRQTRVNWRDEVAIVTGGCSGIGKGIAVGLAQRGVQVAVIDIQDPPADLQQLAASGKDTQRPGDIRYFRCDLTSPEDVVTTADAIRKSFGKEPLILVNNAGMGIRSTIEGTTPETLRKGFDINAISHWYTTHEFLPAMVRQNRGHIVSVASGASFMAMPMGVAYAATKAAALAFHEGLTCEIRNYHKAPGVRTTSVHPAFVRTPMIADRVEQLEQRAGQIMEVEEVVEPVLGHIFEHRGGILMLPRKLWIASLVRSWPSWMQELLRDISAKARYALADVPPPSVSFQVKAA